MKYEDEFKGFECPDDYEKDEKQAIIDELKEVNKNLKILIELQKLSIEAMVRPHTVDYDVEIDVIERRKYQK